MGQQKGPDELAARLDLRRLRYQYCEHLDNHDWEQFLNLFTEGARFDASGVEGMDVIEGVDELREFVFDTVSENLAFSVHQAYHPRIEVDGEVGTGKWSLAEIVVRPDGSTWRRLGSYTDTCRLVDDQWKFAEVEVVIDAESPIEPTLEFPG